jgi:hypothetical protein
LSTDATDRTEQGISRREALKLSAKAAGAAAFATPIVVGAFSAPALAADPPECNPATDSEAVPIQSVADANKTFNVNCQGNSRWGRYNGQNSMFLAPELGPGQTITVTFGNNGIDNFDVECSFYTITAPANCNCTATWVLERANGTAGCATGFIEDLSNPGVAPCPTNVPANAKKLPYCRRIDNSSNCPSGQKIRLVGVVCCCT